MSLSESPAKIIVVTLTTAPGVLGGGVLAAQWHSWFMAKRRKLRLWRMWERDEIVQLDHLEVRNFACRAPFLQFAMQRWKHLYKSLLTSDLIATILEEKPDLVHIQNPSPPFEFYRVAHACHKAGIKVVSSTHGFQECFDPHYGFDKWYQKIGWEILIRRPMRAAFKRIDHFLPGFPEQIAFLEQRGVPRSAMTLMPNGVDPVHNHAPDPAILAATREKFRLEKDRPIILFMGNHTHNKGLGTLMELAEQLDQPATIVVGGALKDGEPDIWLDGRHIPAHVRILFTGFLSSKEQHTLYHLARIFAFPSISETLPLVVLEAMAAGLPTVAFQTGGVGYELAEGAGIAIPLGDKAGFFAAISLLLRDDDRHAAMSSAARARQQAIFGWDRIAEATLAVYDEVLARR